MKGRETPTRIFALLGDEAFAAEAAFQQLRVHQQQMLAAYRAQRWAEALALIQQCLAVDTPRTRTRALYRCYTERIAAYQAAPPAPDWDGVFTATTK